MMSGTESGREGAMSLSALTEFKIPGPNGYDIPAMANVCGNHHTILLCLHGFGGSRRSPKIAALAAGLDADGIGVAAFDWPAHGDSAAPDEALTVENCLRDLDAVTDHIRVRWPMPMSCFATSYGGYLAALYRNAHADAFDRLVLRSPALRMARTFIGFFSDAERARFLAGEPSAQGFDRIMYLTASFYESLLRHDAFAMPVTAPERVLILQGDRDDVVLPDDTAAYAERNHIRVVWFPGSDHRFGQPGDVDRIVSATRAFLADGTVGAGIQNRVYMSRG